MLIPATKSHILKYLFAKTNYTHTPFKKNDRKKLKEFLASNLLSLRGDSFDCVNNQKWSVTVGQPKFSV